MRLIVLVFVMLTVGIGHAAVYKYINKQGKTAYSDIPVAGAEKVIVPPVMTYKAPVIQQVTQTSKKLPSSQVAYQYLRITQPSDQGTVRNNQGQLTVKYAIEPSLQEGDRLMLSVDGVSQESMSISGLSRGQHSLALEVVSANNELRISSATTVFYLQHASKLN